jgi:hypothetical protein
MRRGLNLIPSVYKASFIFSRLCHFVSFSNTDRTRTRLCVINNILCTSRETVFYLLTESAKAHKREKCGLHVPCDGHGVLKR